MDGKKNFEAYAKSLFGEDYGEKKAEKMTAAPWSQPAKKKEEKVPSPTRTQPAKKKEEKVPAPPRSQPAKKAEKVPAPPWSQPEKKAEKVPSLPWSQPTEDHPKPFDVIVVDSSNNILTGEETKKKKKTTGIGKYSKKAKNPSKDDGRLTPIIIDMNESPFEEDKRNLDVRKRKLNDKKQSEKGINLESVFDFSIENEQPERSKKEIKPERNKKENKSNKSIKNKLKLERRGSERDDSGISLNGEENEPFAFNISRDDSESDSDLAYFCVDHMKMCNSRSDFRKHRKCNLDCTKSGTNSPVALKSLKKVKSKSSLSEREIEPEAKQDQQSSSVTGGSRGFSRAGRTSKAALIGMQTMCKETLEKLYNYAGVIIEDRLSLKAELRDKKCLMEEMMLQFMEEIITHLLKLKNTCLDDIERKHKENLLNVIKHISRIDKIQDEIYTTWETLQVSEDFGSFEKYKELIIKATERAEVLQEILNTLHKSCDNYTYEYIPAGQVTGIYDIESLACVKEIPAIPLLPPFLSVKSTDDDENQDPDYTSLKSIERIENVGGKHESGSGNCCFTGCAYILDDSVLLADWSNGVIKMLNNLGLVADTLEFQKSPWDVVQTCSGQAAVTVPQLKTVFFVEAEPHLRVVGKFETRCHCFGICKIGDNYALTCDPWSKSPSVRVFDRLGNTLLQVRSDGLGENYFKCPLHICSDYFNTVMYISDATADCVYAISLTGDIIFCYEHDDLEYPTGVATDRNNCLFVCGKTSSNIHKLSNSGALQEMLVRHHHGLNSPCAVAFHPNGDHMIVTDLDGEMSSGYWKLKFM